MYVRFIIADRDARTGQPMGLMTLAYAVLRSDMLSAEEERILRGHLEWVQSHLPVPVRFARKRNVSHKETHGISWLKPDQGEVLERLHGVARLLIGQGYEVEVLETERPGYVVYQDNQQIVAEPFHGESHRRTTFDEWCR